jgi:putative membrane protein
MNDDTGAAKSPDLSTRWAADRTLWAADRTFIAWLRTSISMIGFGIGIGKAGDVLEQHGIELGPTNIAQYLGMAFIAIAILGLIGALIQNFRIERRLGRQGYARVEPTPLAQVMGILVVLFGLAGSIFIFV